MEQGTKTRRRGQRQKGNKVRGVTETDRRKERERHRES
jgi:hypothetical protein